MDESGHQTDQSTAIHVAAGGRVRDITVQGDVAGRDIVKITEELIYDVSELSTNPYLGLASYTYATRALYGGREPLIRDAVARLTAPGDEPVLVFVTGASGSGKSSFAQAGLLPALEQAYAAQGRRVRWSVVRPGRHPIEGLGRALRELGLAEPRDGDWSSLLRAPEDLNHLLGTQTPIGQVNVLIFDQFEELFTQADPAGRDTTCALLSGLQSFKQLGTHVVATLRADYLAALFGAPMLLERYKRDGIELRAMSSEELARAIRRPIQEQARLENKDKRLDPALVGRLVEDVGGDSALLPLLQVTLRALWDEPPHKLVLGRYRSLTHTLEEQANQLLDQDRQGHKRAATEREQLMGILLDLIEVSLDDDPRRDVRRALPRQDVVQGDAERTKLIEELVNARLITTWVEQRGQTSVEMIDIIHETLLANWPRLRDAIAAQREALQQRERFRLALREWLQSGRSDKYLLTGGHFIEAMDVAKRWKTLLQNADARELLTRSEARDLVSRLRDPHCAEDETGVKDRYEAQAKPVTPAPGDRHHVVSPRGALGFFLFALAANKLPVGTVAGDRGEYANQLLDDDCVRTFLYDLYEVGSDSNYRVDKLCLHAVGTTSYILKLPDKNAILKLIQPRYFDIPSIEEATGTYFASYGKAAELTHAPTIYESKRRYIAMDLVPGATLGAHLISLWKDGTHKGDHRRNNNEDEDRKPRKKNDANQDCWIDADGLKEISQIFASICFTLAGYYDRQHISHGDLSSDNILVVQEGRGHWEPRFIDFGVNYLASERVGDSIAFRRIRERSAPELFRERSAPELFDGPAAGFGVAVDIYSIGVLLMEALLGWDFEGWNIEAAIDRVCERYRGFGAILDDLLDEDPVFRGRETIGVGADANPWKCIGAAITREFDEELALRAADNEKLLHRLLFPLVSVPFVGLNEWIGVKRDRLGIDLASVTGRAQVALILTSLVIAFPWLPFDRFKLIADPSEPLASLLNGALSGGSLMPNELEHGTMQGWVGWLLAALLALVATKYYVSILSGQALRRSDGFAARTSALCSWIFVVSCIGGLYSDPKAWPAWGVIGVGMMALNNLACLRVCNAALKTMQQNRLSVSPAMREVREGFHKWAGTTLGITAGLLVSAAAFESGRAQPDSLYATITISVMVFTYVVKCCNEAPVMRLGLARLLRGQHRGQWKSQHTLSTDSLA